MRWTGEKLNHGRSKEVRGTDESGTVPGGGEIRDTSSTDLMRGEAIVG